MPPSYANISTDKAKRNLLTLKRKGADDSKTPFPMRLFKNVCFIENSLEIHHIF